MVLVSILNLRGCRCGQCYCKRPPFIGPSTCKPKNTSGYTPPPPTPPNVGPPLAYIEMNSTFYDVLKLKKEKSILISTAM